MKSDTLTERVSEKPQTPQPINIENYVTKAEFDQQISMRDQEIVSLKKRLQLTEAQLAQTKDAISAIQEKLEALSPPPIQSRKDNPTDGEKETQEKGAVGGKGKELITQGESSFSKLLEKEK